MNEQVNNVGDFFGNLFTHIANAIPVILGAALILLIGYFVAKALYKVVDGLLDKVNLDEKLHKSQGGNIIQKAVPHPSDLLGKIVFWLVMLFTISAAVSVLGIPLLTNMVEGIFDYIPNVIAAVLIFLVAGAVAGGVTGLVQRTMGDTSTGKIVKTVAPVVIMAIAGFMILNQLMIAPAIVTITYAAILGSAGLGLALAFGLGGKNAAGQMVDKTYERSQQNKGKVMSDVKVARQRSKDDARKLQKHV